MCLAVVWVEGVFSQIRSHIGRCIKLIVSWRSSSDEQAGRDHMKVIEKVVVKVNLKELVLNKLASYV